MGNQFILSDRERFVIFMPDIFDKNIIETMGAARRRTGPGAATSPPRGIRAATARANALIDVRVIPSAFSIPTRVTSTRGDVKFGMKAMT